MQNRRNILACAVLRHLPSFQARLARIFLALVFVVSCSKQDNDSAKHEGHGHEEGSANFEAGKGILLSKESLESVGVKTAEVEEHDVRPAFSVRAQVFRSADEKSSMGGQYRRGFAYASASLPLSWRETFQGGAKVSVKKGETSDGDVSARVVKMDESLQTATRSIEALLEIPDESTSFPIGTFVAVTFSADKARSAIAIPSSALLRASEGNFVYVQNGRHLLRTAVKVGASDGNWIEITDGLLPGDVVAVSAVEPLWTIELRAVKGGGHCH